jgi:hypothetical protein
MNIRDPRSSQAATVENNRLFTRSVTATVVQESAANGDTYNVNTGTINLTSGNKSAVLWIKNNATNDIFIDVIGYLLGNSTGGSGDLVAEVKKNPTSGTLISNATPVEVIQNKNFSSSDELDILAYKGVEGATVTDGITTYLSLLPAAARSYSIATGNVVLAKGNSLSAEVTPQTGNTSMDCQFFVSVIESKI